jgi:hypothetical protein
MLEEEVQDYRVIDLSLLIDALELLKEQQSEIERLEHDLAVTQDNLNYYVNGNA